MIMNQSKFKVWFMPKRTKLLRNGKAPIIVRIYVGQEVSEFSIRRSVDLQDWNAAKEQAAGDNDDLNNYITIVKARIIDIYNDLNRRGEIATAKSIKNIYQAQISREKIEGICHLYQMHNERCRALVGVDYSLSTVLKFEYMLRSLREFIFITYQLSDYPLERLDYNFICKFELYLKSVRHCNNNSAVNNIKVLKKIAKEAVKLRYIEYDPFEHFKYRLEEVDIEFLTEEELHRLAEKEFEFERLRRVRDIFLFCCLTSLSYADVATLTQQHIYLDGNGDYWIHKCRVKTKIHANIPLIKPAMLILDKYRDDSRETLLPLPTNQRFNGYLKEIADVCGIKKRLTSHVARFTAATTVLLANNVSIENVAKILGHKDLKMTQHYAMILDKSIMRDMKVVEYKLGKIK